MTRRLLALSLCLILGLGLLIACTPAGNGPAGPAATPDGPGPGPGPGTPITAVPPGGAAEAPVDPGATVADHIDLIVGNTIGVINFTSPAGSGPSVNMVYRVIFDTLVYQEISDCGTEMNTVPMLATHWETDDYINFVFHLRDDVYFHNGDKFTAHDVAYTIARGHDSPGSQAFNTWVHVDDTEIIDDYTIRLILRSVNPDFLDTAAMMFGGMLNARAIAEDPERGFWVGTGAFIITDFQPNDFVEFERNDNFWLGPVPTQGMTWRVIPEASARTIMLQNRDVDIAFDISDADMPIFQHDSSYSVVGTVINFPHGIHFNMHHPITGCWYFRQAVARAIDREEIRIMAQGDWGVDAFDGAQWGFTMAFRNTDIPLIPQDLDAAREYLANSVYNGEDVEIVTANPHFVRAAEVIQDQLSRIGISIVVNQMDTPGFSAYTLEGDTEMIFWPSLLNRNLASVRLNLTPGHANNRARLDNPEVTELVELAATTIDPVVREGLYHRIQELVFADLPFINAFYRMETAVALDGVAGVMMLPTAQHDLRFIHRVL